MTQSGQDAGNRETHGVSPAAQADAGSRERLDPLPTATVEHAILCADGRVHYGPKSLRGVTDLDTTRRVLDGLNHRYTYLYCGGAPHVINSRQRTVTVTAWEPVQTGDGAA